MTKDEIAVVLEKHRLWRREDPSGARANLARAYLADANLADAYLAGADLAGAYLAGAYLAGARNVPPEIAANPPREMTAEECAARAARYRERHPDVPVVEDLDRKILDVVSCGKGELEMSSWHSCETTHCRAGWAITLAGKEGKALEDKLGPHSAGMRIYRASTGRVPNFFASNSEAMEDIRKCAGDPAAQGSAK